MLSIGRAILHNGDCKIVMQSLSKESIDFIVTDPPYECSTTIITRENQKNLDSHFGSWDIFNTDWLSAAYDCLKPDSGMIVFVPATRFETLMNACEKNGFKYVQPWFYHKSNPAVSMRNALQWAVEHMIYVTKGKHKLRIQNRGKCHNIFKHPVPGSPRYHKTQKPVSLMREIIQYVADVGQTILDPFNGSASTGVAALSLGMHYIGIEQNLEFYQKSCDRLKRELEIV